MVSQKFAQEQDKMTPRLELEMAEEIYLAEEQIASGEGIAHEDAKTRVLQLAAEVGRARSIQGL